MNWKQYLQNSELASAIVDELSDWSSYEDTWREELERENNREIRLNRLRMLQCEEVIKLLCKELLNNIDDVE